VNNDSEGMWKEGVVAYFETLSQYFPGETDVLK
jgi:hypothetical protein